MKQGNKKATNAEIDLRIEKVFEMVSKGVNKKNILRYCAEKFKINTRQTEEYLKRVREQIKALYPENYKTDIMGEHFVQLDHLYELNYQNQDYRECRNLIESKNKMLGIGITKVDLTTKGESLNYRPIFGEIDPMLYEDTQNNGVE